MRYNYERDLSPPAPFVYFLVSRPETAGDDLQWPAQLDSGADRTGIPIEMVHSLGLAKTGEIPVGGLGGRVTMSKTYLVRLAVRDRDAMHVEVIAVGDEPHVLLGRDVLNRHRVVLDGRRMMVEI